MLGICYRNRINSLGWDLKPLKFTWGWSCPGLQISFYIHDLSKGVGLSDPLK